MAKPALADQLTSTVPADPNVEQNFPMGPNLTGGVGQFMGDPSTFAPNQEQLRVGAQEFHGISSEEWAKLSDKEKAEAVASYAKFQGENLAPGIEAKAEKKSKTTPTSATDKALASIQQYLTSMAGGAETAMGVEGQQLAQQNAAVTSTVDQYLGGGGVSSGNPAVDAAQAAYQKAYSAGEGLNSAAYANMGAANAQFLQAAPEQSVVNLLTQGLGSGQYKELPPALVNSLPESVRQALSQAGITETTGSGAGTPIPTGKGSTSASSNIYNLLNGIQQQGQTGVANPLSGINPPATTTNSNTPGA